LRLLLQVLEEVSAALVSEGIRNERELAGVLVEDVEGATEWHQDVQAFVQRMCETAEEEANNQDPEVPERFSKRAKSCLADAFVKQPTTVLNVKGTTPLGALRMLKRDLQDDPSARDAWRGKAKVAAILGSFPRSTESFKSGKLKLGLVCVTIGARLPSIIGAGLRHWLEYIEVVYGAALAEVKAFPPSTDDILGWSNTFRSPLLILCYPSGLG